MRQFAAAPTFDEYVAARGPDLLLAAQLLTGDRQGAQDLVQRALGRTVLRWERILEEGAGSYDANVRAAMMRVYLARRWWPPTGEAGTDAPPRSHEPATPGDGPEPDLLTVLASLPRGQRAVIVLRHLEGLTVAQTAQALDCSEGSVRSRAARAVDTLHRSRVLGDEGAELPGLVANLGPMLASAAAEAIPPDGLADGARRHAAHLRRTRHHVGTAVLAGVVLVAGALAVASGRDGSLVPVVPVVPVVPDRTTTAPPFQLCQRGFPAGVPEVTSARLSSRVDTVLVCAYTGEDSVWSGSLPPDDAVTAPWALDSLALERPSPGDRCGDLPRGPAFRMLVRSRDGVVTSYPNESLRCHGWPALASYYVAVAEQRANPRAGPYPDGYLGCPPLSEVRQRPAGVGQPLARGTTFTTGTACLHPDPRLPLTTVPIFRAVRANVLGDRQLAPLNADLAHHGSHASRGPGCDAGPWTYVVRAVTTTGRIVDLVGTCPQELAVDGAPRDVLRVSEETASMVRALVLVR